MKNRAIQVSTIGLNSRTLSTFEFFFKTTCKGKYKLCQEHSDAHITFADIDMPGTDAAIGDYRGTDSDNILVCLSLDGESEYGSFNIKKPINSGELVRLLDQINESISSVDKKEITETPHAKENVSDATQATDNVKKFNRSNTSHAGEQLNQADESDFVGVNKDVDISNPRELAYATYDPQRMFQGAVLEGYRLAKDQRCAIQVRSLSLNVIIDPGTFTVYTASPDSIMRPTCVLESTSKPQFTEIQAKGLKAAVAGLKRGKNTKIDSHDVEAFLWRIALWSSRGRVPINTDLTKPVYLIHWPNLTRLTFVPHAARIASLLVSAPDTLCHIAERLNVPQRYVFGFYSACNALDLSGIAKRQVDNMFEVTEAPVSHSRGMLRKILGHITRRSKPRELLNQSNGER